jgi:hypothetical protein
MNYDDVKAVILQANMKIKGKVYLNGTELQLDDLDVEGQKAIINDIKTRGDKFFKPIITTSNKKEEESEAVSVSESEESSDSSSESSTKLKRRK